jgi:phosphatidyl-myo-inositol dimannoside synthase
VKILFLATDAYGGHGGIAYYNRCLIEALVDLPRVEKVTVLPRVVKEPPTGVPEKVAFLQEIAGGKSKYLAAVASQILAPVDLVICGHVNLLPVAAMISTLKRVPLVLQVHGIEVWTTPGRMAGGCFRAVSQVWSVSAITLERMGSWTRVLPGASRVIPNTIHPERYGMAPKREDLLQRHGLQGRKVLMTLARLDARERYKGVDEVLESLPALLQQDPNIVYVIAGDGSDKARLVEKAGQLGVGDKVIFAGYVPEREKADFMRLADVFAMPGRGEGFGIVYLEAMACGVPVVGSTLDGSREALRSGQLGVLVDPGDAASLQAGIERALRARREVPEGLSYFAWPAFKSRVSDAMESFA